MKVEVSGRCTAGSLRLRTPTSAERKSRRHCHSDVDISEQMKNMELVPLAGRLGKQTTKSVQTGSIAGRLARFR
jgi:hypothetical protein